MPQTILPAIEAHQSFLVTAHIHPEGDAIASQLAMAGLLRSLGKTVRIINEDPVPHNLRFLPSVEMIESTLDAPEEQFDAIVVLDCGSLSRVGAVQSFFRQAPVINIDHHISNDRFGTYNWVDSQASSAGEMVYQLFKSAGVPFDACSALWLYVAIMTDTGSFRYANTTGRTHRIAAELLQFDIKPTDIYEHIYETKSFATLKMLGAMLNELQVSPDGAIVWGTIPRELMARFALAPEHTEHFIDFARMAEGAKVVVIFREFPNDQRIKISFRSKSGIDVNKIAQQFGGGGHRAASGCLLTGDIDGVRRDVLAAIAAEIAADS